MALVDGARRLAWDSSRADCGAFRKADLVPEVAAEAAFAGLLARQGGEGR